MSFQAFDDWKRRALQDFVRTIDEWLQSPKDAAEWGRQWGIEEAAKILDWIRGRWDNWHKDAYKEANRRRLGGRP